MKKLKMLLAPAMIAVLAVTVTSCFGDSEHEPYNPYDPESTNAEYAAFVTVRNDSTDSTDYWFEYDKGVKLLPVNNVTYQSYSPINSDNTKKDGQRAYITYDEYSDKSANTATQKKIALASVTDLPTQDVETETSNANVYKYGKYKMYVNQVNLSKDGKWLDLIVELQSRDASTSTVAHKVTLLENTDDPDSVRYKKGNLYLELHHNTGSLNNETTSNYIMTYVSFRLPEKYNISDGLYTLVLKFTDKEGADRYLHINASGETKLTYEP